MRRTLKKYLPNHETIRRNRWLRPFESSLLHPRLWHLNRHSAAGAVAVGVAGLFMETHPDPSKAMSDGPNAVPLKHMKALLETLVALDYGTKKTPFLENAFE